MSKETQIEVITYEQERLDFFTKAMNLAQKRYNRLFKIFKDDPYLSEGTTMVSDAGRETQFYHDVVEMLENGYRKQSEWISVDERLPETGDSYIVVVKLKYEWESEWEYHTDVAVFRFFDGYIDDVWDTFVDWNEGQECHVTHWMPLPEAPKMKGGE